MQAIFNASMADDEEIQATAMQVLSEIPSVAFKYMPQYVPKVGEITVTLMASTRYKSIKFALLFWNNLCKEEQRLASQPNNHVPLYMQQYSSALIQIIL